MKTSVLLCFVLAVVVSLACSGTGNILEQNKALIREANEKILNKGNLAFANDVFSADYRNNGSEKRGPEVIKRFVTALRTAFPDLNVTIEPIVAEADMVAWQRTHTGTHQGEFMGIPATGKKITWRTMVFSRISGGKVVEEWGLGDLQEILQTEVLIEWLFRRSLYVLGVIVKFYSLFAHFA